MQIQGLKTLHLFQLSTQCFPVLTLCRINIKVSQTYWGTELLSYCPASRKDSAATLAQQHYGGQGTRVTSSFWEGEVKRSSSMSLSVTSLPPKPTSN